jgi:hypothetical protein
MNVGLALGVGLAGGAVAGFGAGKTLQSDKGTVQAATGFGLFALGGAGALAAASTKSPALGACILGAMLAGTFGTAAGYLSK